MNNKFEINVTTSFCECCEDVTYHIPIDMDSVSYEPDEGFHIHLSQDEMTALYFELKEYKTGLKEVACAE